jgi:hypothetical protein
LYVNNKDVLWNDTVKIKQNYRLSCITKYKGSEITTGVSYSWSFKPSLESLTSFISYKNSPKNDSSEIDLVFKDSLPKPLSIQVHGHVVDGKGSNSTQEITRILLVRLFKPSCSVRINNNDTTYVNAPDPKLFTVSAVDTADKSGPPGAVSILYQLNGDKTWSSFDSSKGITFNSAGDKTVYFIARDNDTLFSMPCSASVVVIANKPYIKAPDIITAISNQAANKAVDLSQITAQEASGGKFPVDSVYWDLDNNGSFETVTSPEKWPVYSKPDTGTFIIRVFCTDNRKQRSDTNLVTIAIVSGVPKISKVELLNKVQFINTPVSIALQCKVYNNPVLTVAIDTNGVLCYTKNNVPTGNDTLQCKFITAGHFKLRVRVFNSYGADTMYVSDSLIIDQGIPVIDTIFITPADTIYINDTLNISAKVTDNGSISAWFFSIDSTTSTSSTTLFKKDSIKTSGKHIVYVRVRDNDGNLSDWKPDTIMVYSGAPEVRAIIKDDSVYIHNTASFSVKLFDINGTLKRIDCQWKSDTMRDDFEQKSINKSSNDTVIITHTFDIKDTGSKTIYFRVMDDDTVLSGWKSCTVKILKGEPVITGVTRKSSYSDTVFIKDSVKFTLFASDPNSVNEIRANISWNGDTIFEDTGKLITNGSLLISHTYSVNSDTTITVIRFRVIDRDTLYKDSLYPITIRSGAPIIDRLTPDTVFVKDQREYTILARDPDGSTAQCDSFEYNFGQALTGSKTGKFLYTFQDTNPSSIGKRSVTVRARDKNLLWTTKTCTVFVDLGRPVISGFNNYGNTKIQWKNGSVASSDTMFYQWTPGQPTEVAVDTTDNDSCVSYFWNWESEDFVDATTAIPKLTIAGLRSNQVNRVTVTGTDNDNINSLPYSFYVFPDGPPPVPVRFIEQSDVDSLKLLWNDTTDFKDGGETQFKVLYKFGTSGNPDLVAINNIAQKNIGTQLISSDNYNYVKIYSAVPTWVRWQVIVKDVRGSESASEIRQYYYSK